MKSNLFAVAISLLTAASASLAAEPATTSHPALGGPKVTGLFRIVKPDGATLIQQAAISPAGSAINTISVATSDAFFASNGKCAFNVKYDEVSPSAATNTLNRLYDNDTLIAQNSKIDLVPNVVKTIWTQPYLNAGQNNVKIVINADSSTPSIGWVRVNVSGSCGAAPAPTPKYTPGSAEWNTLNTAWGYSNYAVTQLKGKNYARYNDLVKLNTDITAAINAKSVEQATYNSLITRWNGFANDAAFKAAMAGIAPSTTAGRK